MPQEVLSGADGVWAQGPVDQYLTVGCAGEVVRVDGVLRRKGGKGESWSLAPDVHVGPMAALGGGRAMNGPGENWERQGVAVRRTRRERRAYDRLWRRRAINGPS
jgi:hypothetical protein